MAVVHQQQITVYAHHPSSTSVLGGVFPLGPLDSLVSTAVPISVCFVYPSALNVDKLQNALAQLLDHYAHLTGRLRVDKSGNASIDRPGTGAELYLAKCDQTIAKARDGKGRVDLAQLPDGGNDLLPPFDPTKFDVDPILTVKYTAFSDGSVLGIRCHHMVCDGTGYFQLVGHLAELYTTGKVAVPPIIHPFRPSKGPGDYKPARYSMAPQTMTLPGTPVIQPPVIGRFIHFDKAYLSQLKVRATPSGGWTSTYAAVVAHLYHITHRARRILYAKDTLSDANILVSINLRTRTPDIPAEYFSNAVLTPNDRYDSDALFDADLRDVTAFVNRIIREQIKPDEIDDTLRWLHAQEDKTRIDSGFRFGNGGFATAQWSGFDLYGAATFDECRPVLVAPPFTPISLCNGLMYTLPPAPNGEGTEEGLMICLSLEGKLWDVIDERGLMKVDNIGISMSVRERAIPVNG